MARWHRATALTAEDDGSLQLAAWRFPKENIHISSLTLRSTCVPDDYWDFPNTESAGPVPTLLENSHPCSPSPHHHHLPVSQLPKQG